jgi:2-oxoglutarate dehydrogenase E1 component
MNSFFVSKFSTVKRFGIEGLDALISGLETTVDKAHELGVESINIGMPHRGRLNTLATVMNKPLEEIFSEF